jgi:signal transduction histidine kinase
MKESLEPADELASSSPASAEVGPRRPSRTRPNSAARVGEPWRDRLLQLSVELPLDLPLAELGALFLEALSTLLPGAALGARIAVPDADSIEVRRGSRKGSSKTAGDGGRMFPDAGEEQLYLLRDGDLVSTLHIASVGSAGRLSARHRKRAESAAPLLGAALARARRFSALEGLQHRLQQAEKLASLGKIVAGVAHELNNPLTSILVYASQLNQRLTARRDGDREEDLERIRRITESAERVAKFTRDLVAYARPAADLQASCALHDVLEKALHFCDHEFSSAVVQVERAYPCEGLALRGTSDQLTQVFVNLFTNSAHAMRSRSGRLRVKAAADASGDFAIVEVIDDGVGISSQHLPHIFEPFYTTKTNGQGTGLGLAIVLEIITAHGGTIDVDSAAESGTAFRVKLPLARRQPA